MTEIAGKLDLHAPAAAPDEQKPAEDNTRAPTLTGTFRRVRRGPSVRLKDVPRPADPAPEGAPAPTPPPAPRPARVAIMLALAHKLQRMLDDGQIASMADIADMLGVTRARVTQLLDLTLLPVAVQERLLFARAGTDGDTPTERQLRALVGQPWATTPPPRTARPPGPAPRRSTGTGSTSS